MSAPAGEQAPQPVAPQVEQQAKHLLECLRLTLVAPFRTGHVCAPKTAFEAEPQLTGAELKVKIRDVVEVAPESQLLFFQNGCRNAAKIPLQDDQSLEAQGLVDGATVTVRVNEQEVLPENSQLRQSISKNGGSSYYYAHANETNLPLEQRYVYGGDPQKLDDAAPLEAAGSCAAVTTIAKYAWADEGDFVCIYISAEGEAEAVTAAKDGKGGEVTAEFGDNFAELRIHGETREYGLAIRNLEHEIVVAESKHRVSAGKRITLKLKKKRKVAWTRLMRPCK